MGKGDGLDGLLTTGQVAEILGVTRHTTVWHHVNSGRLRVERRIVQGRRTIALFDPAEVRRFAQTLLAERRAGGRGHRKHRHAKNGQKSKQT